MPPPERIDFPLAESKYQSVRVTSRSAITLKIRNAKKIHFGPWTFTRKQQSLHISSSPEAEQELGLPKQ